PRDAQPQQRQSQIDLRAPDPQYVTDLAIAGNTPLQPRHSRSVVAETECAETHCELGARLADSVASAGEDVETFLKSRQRCRVVVQFNSGLSKLLQDEPELRVQPMTPSHEHSLIEERLCGRATTGLSDAVAYPTRRRSNIACIVNRTRTIECRA